MPRKYPPLGRGEGYSTEGKDEFDHTVAVTFDYDQFISEANYTSRMLNENLRAMRADFGKSFNIKGNGLFRPTIKSPGTYQSIILFDKQDKKLLEEDLSKIASLTADEMKQHMKGIIRTAPGARGAGRIDTHRMIDSVFGRKVIPAKNKITAKAGWLDTWYKYFGFQEEGTVTGIKPMHMILGTAAKTFPDVAKTMAAYMRNFGSRGGFRGFKK